MNVIAQDREPGTDDSGIRLSERINFNTNKKALRQI